MHALVCMTAHLLQPIHLHDLETLQFVLIEVPYAVHFALVPQAQYNR
jgi:hypothetical protein